VDGRQRTYATLGDQRRLKIPAGHDADGKLVLNVSYSATRELSLGNDFVSFEARFSGVPRKVLVPLDAILGIYARETGQGMVFTAEDAPSPTSPEGGESGDRQSASEAPRSTEKKNRPSLKIVK
jgi:stringent starvation protein B